MDPKLVKRALHIYHRSHPTYPVPLQIRIIEGTSPSGKTHPVVVLEDWFGLLTALRIRPSGWLEEVVPFPMKVELPGQPGRYRISMLGLPDLLCINGLESELRNPDRIHACVKLRQAQANQAEDVIKYFTQQLEHLIPQVAEMKARMKLLAGDPLKSKDRREAASKVQEIARQITAARTSREALLGHLEGLRKQIEDLNNRAYAYR